MSEGARGSVGNRVIATAAEPFVVGTWTVDPASDEISRDGEVVKLEPRKMLLLVTLAARANQVVTIDELLDVVWAGLVVTQSSVYQSVAQLRKTLGDSRATPDYIATIPRKGYRLIAPVRAIEAIPAVVAADAVVPGAVVPDAVIPAAVKAIDSPAVDGSDAAPIPSPVDGAPPLTTASPARRRWLVGAAAGTGIVALATGAWWLRGTPVAGALIRLAVLPFSDRSPGNLEQAAADGLANDVIHRFERTESVLVLARDSAFTFRRLTDDRAGLQALKQQLDADYALLGELFRTQQRVRVSVRLLAVPGGREIWTNVFAKSAERLAELPSLIAAGVLKALGLEDGPPTEMNSLGAYELYLLGADAYRTQRSIEGLLKARDYFQHAIDTDPGYARAYAGVATTWLTQADTYGIGVGFREAAARAQPLIDKALSLDPGLLEGLIAQATLYMKNNWTDGARARSVMQKAVELYPGNAEAQFFLGATYAFDEQPKEAIRYYAKALELDPLNARFHRRWGVDATFSGDYEAARVRFARATALMPNAPTRFLGPASIDYARGQLDDAVLNYRLQFEQGPGLPDAWGELAWVYLDLGMPAQARVAFAKERELAARTHDADIYETYALLVDGKANELPAWLAARGFDQPAAGLREVDRLVVRAIAGTKPSSTAIDALRDAMRGDPVPWVGSYWIFLGRFAWIDLAMLYSLAGSPAAAAPLLDDAQTMLARLRARGNAFHTIPFLEARIAALRGTPDVALARLGAAVDAGWRRAWILRFDPAFERMRDDPRIAPLVERVTRDIARQRSHVGEAPVDAASPRRAPR